MKFWSVIKYKPKEGCEAEFVDGLKRLKEMFEGKRVQNFIQLGSGEFVEIVCYDSTDIMLELQVEGLTWLDSVDRLLERYEEESRTDAFTGNELDFHAYL